MVSYLRSCCSTRLASCMMEFHDIFLASVASGIAMAFGMLFPVQKTRKHPLSLRVFYISIRLFLHTSVLQDQNLLTQYPNQPSKCRSHYHPGLNNPPKRPPLLLPRKLHKKSRTLPHRALPPQRTRRRQKPSWKRRGYTRSVWRRSTQSGRAAHNCFPATP